MKRRKLFLSKTEKELDAVIARIEMNMSNNYKDAAQKELKNFEARLDELSQTQSVKAEILKYYQDLLAKYQEKMQGYTHKDQKPYWH